MTDEEFRYDPETFVLEPKDDDRDPTGPPVEYVHEAYVRGAISDAELDDEIERALSTETPDAFTWNDDGTVRVRMESARMDGGEPVPIFEGQEVIA